MKNHQGSEHTPRAGREAGKRFRSLRAALAATVALTGASVMLSRQPAGAAIKSDIRAQANARLDTLYWQLESRLVKAAKDDQKDPAFDVSSEPIEQTVVSPRAHLVTVKGRTLQLDSTVVPTRVTPAEGYNLSVTNFSKTSLNSAGIKTDQQTVLPYSSLEISLYQRDDQTSEFQPQLDLTPGLNTPLYSEDLYKDLKGNWNVIITNRMLGRELGSQITYTTGNNSAVGEPFSKSGKVPVTYITDLGLVNRMTEQSEEMLGLALNNYPLVGVSSNLGSPSPVSYANLAIPVEE
ncbi:MAG TPA: hypothetical protein VIH90_00510 [Candidatus Saccharimonadales bacterium]